MDGSLLRTGVNATLVSHFVIFNRRTSLPRLRTNLPPANIGQVLRRVENIENGNHNHDDRRLEHIKVPLVRRQVSALAQGKLHKPIDGPHKDQTTCGVDSPEEVLPFHIRPLAFKGLGDEVKSEGDDEEEAKGDQLHTETYL